MSRTSDCRKYQEIIAALLLPGPLDATGKSGWNVRELTAACPAVGERHDASLVLNALSKREVTCHVGAGTASRHYIRNLPHGGPLQGGNPLRATPADNTEYLQGCPQKWYPSRDTLIEIAQNRDNVLALLRDIPKGGAHVQQWIWDAWNARPATPLTHEQIIAVVMKAHQNCEKHIVSQQLNEMVKAGKLRRHKESGKAAAYIPVREPDLFTLSEAAASESVDRKKPAQSADDLVDLAEHVETGECSKDAEQMGGILPQVSIYLGDDDEDCEGVFHDREVRAFVALDIDGNIRSVRIDSKPSDLLSPCA